MKMSKKKAMKISLKNMTEDMKTPTATYSCKIFEQKKHENEKIMKTNCVELSDA